ncbi:mechanosensitive ion channel [Kamptonema formosum]|uniref:mechanosensitive ion channel n=1 Tax=Kamptonema formosum TaxID=331992 RepID=UPI000477E4FB|nr:mechanosensitive ion channel [Oscillatoria sp. PCC 10802]
MNIPWESSIQTIPVLAGGVLAQKVPAASQPWNTWLVEFSRSLGTIGPSVLLNLVTAIAILVIGWIVAIVAAAIIGGLLKRTDIDNRLAAWITGRPAAGAQAPPVEKWVASAVFWIVMIFVLVAFFDQLKLQAVSVPLNTFLNQVTGFLPKLAAALILLGVAWAIATVAKIVVSQGLRRLGLDERLNQQVGAAPAQTPLLLSETLANALYWFILLLFLAPVLDTLGLQQALEPIQNLLNQILAALPKILKAIIIGGTGWLLAQVVRRLVTNLLAATGTDRLGAQLGVNQTAGGQSLSWIGGTIVYILILIPTAIAALNALEIEAISAPAVVMLTQMLNAIPQIFTAGLILAIAYFIGRFVADLVTNILTGFGFNNIFYWLGLQPAPSARRQPVAPPLADDPATVIQPPVVPARTPSEIAGIVVQVGILLLATVAAINILNIEALTAIVAGLVVIAGRVLAGLVVFALGLYFANLAFNLISSSGSRQAGILAQAARIAIIILVSAMALEQMGIAGDIVNLAFGLLFGAIAVAIAIAFGLGGRDLAATQMREWLSSFKERE